MLNVNNNFVMLARSLKTPPPERSEPSARPDSTQDLKLCNKHQPLKAGFLFDNRLKRASIARP